MTNFKKLKKTLAVSLCSSMLFSGAPKTSGMNNENIPLLNSNDLKMPKKLRNLGVGSFMKERSTAVVEWVFGTIVVELLNYIIEFGLKELNIVEDINASGELYNQVKDLLDLLKRKKVIGNVSKDSKKAVKDDVKINAGNEIIDTNTNTSNINETDNDINPLMNFDSYDNDFSIYLELSKKFLEKANEHRMCICNYCKCCKDFFLGRADQEVSYVQDSKEEIINNIAKTLGVIAELKDKLNDKLKKQNEELPKTAENLYCKLNKILDSIKDSKLPEVNLELAINYTKKFLFEAKIIEESDKFVLEQKINERKKSCCCKSCILF